MSLDHGSQRDAPQARPTPSARRPRSLLLVAFDGLRLTNRGGARIEAGLAERASLTQQVPALVERDLDALEPPTLGVARGPRRLSLPELLLLGYQPLDLVVDLIVSHCVSLRARRSVERTREPCRRPRASRCRSRARARGSASRRSRSCQHSFLSRRTPTSVAPGSLVKEVEAPRLRGLRVVREREPAASDPPRGNVIRDDAVPVRQDLAGASS